MREKRGGKLGPGPRDKSIGREPKKERIKHEEANVAGWGKVSKPKQSRVGWQSERPQLTTKRDQHKQTKAKSRCERGQRVSRRADSRWGAHRVGCSS